MAFFANFIFLKRFFSKGALSLLKDKASLESVIEAIENGSAEIAAVKLESQPQTEASDGNSAEVPGTTTPEEFEARKKQIEEKIKQRRLETEGMEVI